MTNSVPFVIVGSRTQISDVPFVFHVSISNGRPVPSMPTNAMSSPVALDCRSSYEKPDGEFSAMRTSTGKPESVDAPV